MRLHDARRFADVASARPVVALGLGCQVKRRLASGEVVDEEELEAAPVRPPPPAPAPRSATSAPTAAPAPSSSLRTDLELLEALVLQQSRLTIDEYRAFGGMLDRLRAGWIRALSYPQHAWAQEVAARVGLNVDAPDDWREVAAELRRDPTIKPR